MRTRNQRMRAAGRRLSVPGGAAPWTPASIPGIDLLLIAGPSYCFTDAAGTVPAGDGDSVRVWKDYFLRGYDFSQATADQRPTLTLSGGRYAVVFDGVNDNMSYAGTFPQVAADGQFGLSLVGAVTNGTNLPFIRYGGSTPQWRLINQFGEFRIGTFTGSGNPVVGNAHVSGRTVIVAGYDGAELRVAAGDETDVTLAADPPIATSSEVVAISSNLDGYDRMAGSIESLIWGHAVISASDRQRLKAYFGFWTA